MDKMTTILWIFFGIALTSCQGGKHLILSENATIVLPSKPDKWEQKAAAESQAVKARYIKVIGKNKRVAPVWHHAADLPSWIFIDEVMVE